MEENILKELENSQFNQNKYYMEIIKGFMSEYPIDTNRINISNQLVHIKASDIAGSRDIYFSLEADNLKITINRNVDLKKYQDIIIYNPKGTIIERSKCIATLKEDMSEDLKNNSEIMLSEFDKLGQNNGIYTGKIFADIDLKVIKRDEKEFVGLFKHQITTYNEKGLRKGERIEGHFDIDPSNLWVLEFPLDEKVRVTNVVNLDDVDVYTYPNSRSL